MPRCISAIVQLVMIFTYSQLHTASHLRPHDRTRTHVSFCHVRKPGRACTKHSQHLLTHTHYQYSATITWGSNSGHRTDDVTHEHFLIPALRRHGALVTSTGTFCVIYRRETWYKLINISEELSPRASPTWRWIPTTLHGAHFGHRQDNLHFSTSWSSTAQRGLALEYLATNHLS